MKTAISLPDDLFDQVDDHARQAGWSRSRLVREALVEHLLRHDPDAVTAAMDEFVEALASESDSWRRAASDRRLGQVDW